MKKLIFSGFLAAIMALGALVPGEALAYGGGGGFLPIGGFGFSNQRSAEPAEPPQPAGQVLGATTFTFATNLGYGARGNDVIELHKVLIAEGYLHIPAPTGWFGPLTLAAVKEYQAANGIITTGFVGPLTRGALNQGNTPVPTAAVETSALKRAATTVKEVVGAALAWSAST